MCGNLLAMLPTLAKPKGAAHPPLLQSLCMSNGTLRVAIMCVDKSTELKAARE